MASEPQVASISATPTTEVVQSTTESSDEDRDVTEENLVESVETTTVENDDEDSTEEAEYDDDYYDDEEDYTTTEGTTEAVTEETTVVTEESLTPSTEDYIDEVDEKPTFQDIPEYEPSFPELTESLDSPLLPLKTTVLSSVDFVTSTVTESRLRTYTFVVTRVSGSEQIITSTTEVRPQVKTTVLTEPVTKYTTLTLLDLDDKTDILSSTLDIPSSLLLDQENTASAFSEEARHNLATRVMSNGVEVIVAGDKTTLPGDDAKRILPSSQQVPITLKPSTLTDRMVLMMPQETVTPSESTPLLYNDQFITKTCLTTFTYLTTYLEGSTTAVSSHEQVVSNIATEERNTGKILPTPAVGITLTQYPNLSVGLFRTTYTYLNTILDGEQPLVVSSKHTVTNTVTAPDDYLSFLKPSETSTPLKDTNTYYSTINLEKTLYEGNKSSVISTRELVTQVIITESVPPRATSVMTSYIALDDAVSSPYSTTDVVKTYFVTYTYYNTLVTKTVTKWYIRTYPPPQTW
ncbi:unnamed protein product [Callosobruchus maculatus]|uniref:DUF4758 domain-containing protein n=1 Tax=Callosobruchus maculatus TaxID=64391 RepID=A0A653CZP4_CALMS|nr:unnamed protein product [Callosobruchus maculatus]